MIKNFLTRAFTSIFIFIIFGAIVLSSLFPFAFEITISFLSAFCVYEALNAIKIKSHKMLFALALLYAVAIPLMFAIVSNFFVSYAIATVVFVYLFNIFAMYKFKDVKFFDSASSIYLTVVITSFLTSIIILTRTFEHGLFYLIVAIVCFAWATDIFAYVFGVLFGKHRFSPNISPKKSLEGSIGGTLTCVAVTVGAFYIYQSIADIEFNLITVIIYALICCLVGQIGDFSFSYIKRSFGIKDFGNLLPGHGGVLDRLDSLIFISPMFMLLLTVSPLVF